MYQLAYENPTCPSSERGNQYFISVPVGRSEKRSGVKQEG
jgi:hypothetical protein